MDKALLDFCNTIETLANTNSISSYIPSSKEDVSILPLTLKQQKDIISSQVAGVVGIVRFGRVLNNILIENCKADNLLVCDKSALAIDLRINAMEIKSRMYRLLRFQIDIREEKQTLSWWIL